MKNSLCAGILAVGLLSAGFGHAQGPAPLAPHGEAGMSAPPAYNTGGIDTNLMPRTRDEDGRGGGSGGGGPPPYPPGLSPYLNYCRPGGCCGPVGKDGPILYEIYYRNGVSWPAGGGVFGKILEPGYMFQIGGRTLFFEPAKTYAWTIDLGYSNVWWDAGKDVAITQVDIPATFSIPTGRDSNGQNIFRTVRETIPTVRTVPSSLHQQYAHFAAGQEFYLTPLASCCSGEITWRAGYDAGVRWGTAKVIYNPTILRSSNPAIADQTFGLGLPHGNDTVKGFLLAVHTDVECPYKCCFFHAGLRAEFSHIRSDILQIQNDSNLSMVNVLINLGVRF